MPSLLWSPFLWRALCLSLGAALFACAQHSAGDAGDAAPDDRDTASDPSPDAGEEQAEAGLEDAGESDGEDTAIKPGTCGILRTLDLRRADVAASVWRVADGYAEGVFSALLSSGEWQAIPADLSALTPMGVAIASAPWMKAGYVLGAAPVVTPEKKLVVWTQGVSSPTALETWSASSSGFGPAQSIGTYGQGDRETVAPSLDGQRALFVLAHASNARGEIVPEAILVDSDGKHLGSAMLEGAYDPAGYSACVFALPTLHGAAATILNGKLGKLEVVELNADGSVRQKLDLPAEPDTACPVFQASAAGLEVITQGKSQVRIQALENGSLRELFPPIARSVLSERPIWFSLDAEQNLLMLVVGRDETFMVRVGADGKPVRVSESLPDVVVPNTPGTLVLHERFPFGGGSRLVEVTCNFSED